MISLGSTGKLRPMRPYDIYPQKTPRVMRTSVILPSQQQAFAVCTEVMINWFLSKFREKYFNSVYVDGTHSFDEYRKLSQINQQMKRTNPILAVVPDIDVSYNRDWIDSTPEIPMLLRRSRFEGVFFKDITNNKGLFLQLIFKTIKMNFLYKIRLDTKAQQLDMMEYLKVKHRAGWSETLTVDVDIHVPKGIIRQIAFDNGFKITDDGTIPNPIELLNYLNTHSLIPFIYKLRCSTGNDEFFIKVPNCTVHIKSELPTMNDGDRINSITTNYSIEFNVETEMTAPYCYTYFSQKDQQRYINNSISDDAYVSIMQTVVTEIPHEDLNHWALLTSTEYEVDDSDLNKDLDIAFKELFAGTDLGYVLEYTQRIAISPAIFLNFIIINDGQWIKYEMDWGKMVAHIPAEYMKKNRTAIGIYTNQKYVNDTIININEFNKSNSDRV